MSLTHPNIEEDPILPSENLSVLFAHSNQQDSLSQSISNHKIIINPSAIWNVLALIQQSSEEQQLSLLEDLVSYINEFPINSLTLVSKTSRNLPNNTSHSVIDRLLQLALQIFDSNPRVSNKIVELLVTLYQYNVLEKSHLNILYSHLSERFYSQKLNSDILLFSIQLLQKTISQQIPRQEEPSTFFYFAGAGSSLTADTQQPLTWENNNGLALSIWFYIENNDAQEHNTSKLITLHSDGFGGVEVFFKGQELHYRSLNRTYSEPSQGEQSVLIGTFQAGKWYYLGLEHENAKGIGKQSLKIVINNECKKPVDVALPNIEANSPLTKLSLGENFVGRISSFILFKHSIGQNRLSELYSLLNHGVHNENVLKNLYATIEKILDRVSILYTPQRSDANKVFDVLNNTSHAILAGNAGVGGKDPAKLRFGALGGVAAILPFFNFLKFVDISNHPEILDELWRLILDLFTNFSEAQFEASKIGFFRVVGQLLAENENNLWTSSSIELLADIRNSLTHQHLTEEIFVDLLWNQKVFAQANEQVQNQLWVYLKSIYLQNPAHYDRLFNIRSILDLIIDKFDAQFQTITANNAKNDWSCTTTPEFKDAEKSLGPLLDIVESILSTGGEAVTDGLVAVLNVLSLRCSAYFHLLLLGLLKNILVDKRDNSLFTSKAFIKALTDHKASQHILYLMSQTTCLDLKAMCIKLLNVLLSQSKNNANKGEITQYISNIIWSSTSSQKDQEINFDQIFAKNDAPTKPTKIETDFSESLTLNKVSKSFPKTSKLSLAPFDEETSFSKSATSSFLQNSFQNPRELLSTDTDKKLTEMSLNLRNSVPRDRLDETGSFRKDKTFEFSRKAFGGNDGSSLSKTSEISFPVHDEPVLEKPIFPKKKAQASSSSTGRGKKGFNLTIAPENGEEETQAPAVPTETQEEKPVVAQPEEEKKEEFVLEKPFPKAGDLKRKPKNLAIVAETSEEPTEAPTTEVPSTTQSTLSTTKGPRGFGLSLDTVETQPEEQKEIVGEPKIEVTENSEKGTIEVDVTVEIPKESIIETNKPEEPELEFELAKPKPKFGAKSTKKGGKLKAPAFKIELDVDSINQEFTFGGEKGAKMMDDEEVSNLRAGVLREVTQLAKECVEYMLLKEKEEEERIKAEQTRKEEERARKEEEQEEQDDFVLPLQKPKEEEEKEPDDGFRPPKNMPQSVRGHKKIEFGFKGKPSLEIGGDALNQQTTLSKSDLNSFKSLKPTLEIVEETPVQQKAAAATSSHREEYQLSTNLDVASPEQNQPIIFKTTPKGQTSFPSNKQGKFATEVPSKSSCYEGIYNALIEWLLHKQPSQLLGSVAIDDTDKISCVEVLPVMIKFYKNADEPGKQKMMQDLYILLKWNQSNCSSILQSTDFHFFLLDILYDYQILLYTNELEAHATAIWELGTKSHTVLLKHALYKETEGYKFAFNLFIWLNNKRIIASNKPNPIKYEQGAQYLVRHLWLNFLESINDATDNAKIPLDSPFWTNIQQVAFCTQEIVVSALTSEDLSSRQKESNKISNLTSVITKLQSGEDFPYNFKAIFKQTYWSDWNFCKSLLKGLEPLWTPSKTSISRGSIEDTKVMRLLLGGSTDLNVEGRGCLLQVVLELIVCYFEDSVENNNLSGCEFAGERIRNLIKPLVSLVESLKTEDEEYYNTHKDFLMSSLLFAIKSLYQIAEKNSKNGNKEISEVMTRSIVSVLNNLGKGVKPTPSFKKGASSKKPNLTLGSPTLCAVLLEILALEDQALANLGRFEEPDEGIIYGEYQERITGEEKVTDLVDKFYGKSWTEISQRIREGLQENISQQNQKNSDQEKTSEEALEKSKKEIVEIVGETCENEEQRRKDSIKYHEEYSKIRNGQWSKLWRKLRTYVGPWRHPEFYDQVDIKEDAESTGKREKQNNLLKHKLAKSEVKSRAKPFLKVKLIEPQYVEGYENKVAQQRHEDSEAVLKQNETLCQVAGFESKSNKEESKTSFVMPLGSSWKGSSSRASGTSGTSNLSHMIGSPLKFDNISGNKSYTVSPSTRHEGSPREEIFLSKKCQWIKPLHIRHGTFQITSHRLIFTSDEHQDSSEILFLKDENTHSAATQRISKEWPLDFIREIQKKQFFLKRTGLEIYMVDGSTLLFNFPEGELEEVSQKLVRMRKTRCPNLVYYGSLDSRKIIDKANITKKWLNYEMTNFEYLMWLNSLSGRSFNDLTQYPIFPWILADYASSELNLAESQNYRDFSKPKEGTSQQQQQAPPIQPPETRKKKGMMISIPDSTDEINALVTPLPQVAANNTNIWHCSPLTVVHFLQRLDPYSQAVLKLQKKGIRYPYNKPLDNLEELYKKSSEELIPEFFCLADFLSKWEDKQGDQIELPKWCHNNPQRLVATLRKALESAEVSKMLHHWIDIVFGHKQNSKNVQASFPEEKFNEHLLQAGQPPLQLFNKPHPQRSVAEGLLHNHKLVVDPAADVRVYRPPTKKKSALGEEKRVSAPNTGLIRDFEHLDGSALIKMKVISDSRLIGLRKDGRLTYFKWWSAQQSPDAPVTTPFKCGIEKEKFVKLGKGKHDWCDNIDYSVKYITYPATFLNMGKTIVAGGYWDGRLSLFSTDSDSLLETYFYHSDTITAIASDHKENFLITGSKSGECIVWKISPELTKLTAKFHFYDHNSQINDLFISNDLRLFATASNDGKINIYHFIVGQLLRTIHHPSNLPIQSVILSSNPLPCVIFSSEKDQSIYSYSINGKALEQITTNSQYITSPLVIKDANSIEHLVYGTEKGELFLRKLPFLEYVRKWDVALNCPVLTTLVSKDKKYMFCGCSDGEFSVLTDPSSSIQPPLAKQSGESDDKDHRKE